MSWMARARMLGARLLHREAVEGELEAEVADYFETIVERHVARAASVEEARRSARIEMGGVAGVKENVRDARWGAGFESAMRDVRYAVRSLRKAPGFAMLGIVTLALGIGASTAVFTTIDAVVLRPLSYRDSGQLVVAWERVPFLGGDPIGPNPRHADLWQKRATAFAGLALLHSGAAGVTVGDGHPQLVGTVTASPNLFSLLQVEPLLGRAFRSEDGVTGRDHVAMLTYESWQGLLGGDANVVGKTIRTGDTLRQVVGVLPADFHFPNANALRAFRSTQGNSRVPQPAIFVPAAMDVNGFSWDGEYGNWVALGRLRPGVSARQAEAQLMTIQAQIINEIPREQGGGRAGSLLASVEPLQEAVVGGSKAGLWLLMAAVTGLVLIACLNLANAQLARSLARDRDASIRRAIGASMGRLIWGSLAESLVLAAAGGGLGVLLAVWALKVFRQYAPVDLPRLSEIHVNGTVLLFAMAATIGSSLLSGSMAAIQFLRTDPQRALQQNSGRVSGSRRTRRLQRGLMGFQVFGCTVLLLLTGLFAKNLLQLLREDKGFETGNVVIAEVDLPGRTYAEPAARTGFDDGVLSDLRGMAGVQSAALVSAMPLEGESWIENVQRMDRPSQENPLVNLRWVSDGYFETVREKLVRGRFFEARDRELSSAVLSEGEARAIWGKDDPLGAQIGMQGRRFTVIGIVADSRNTSLKAAPPKVAYVHYWDRPPYVTFFVARGEQPAAVLIGEMRQAIWKRAPDVTIARVKTLDSQMSDSLSAERFQTAVLVAFAGAALLLAMLGIYGVLSYNAARRTQETGVRIALGATRRSIYLLTMREAAMPVIVGLAAGLVTSVLMARVVQSLLYGVRTIDPVVSVVTAALCLGAAACAAIVPARRASAVDPMVALRME